MAVQLTRKWTFILSIAVWITIKITGNHQRRQIKWQERYVSNDIVCLDSYVVGVINKITMLDKTGDHNEERRRNWKIK